MFRAAGDKRAPLPDAAGFRGAVEPASATVDLAPRNAFFHFVSGLQRCQAVLEELEAVENVRVAIDVNQDSGQPASL